MYFFLYFSELHAESLSQTSSKILKFKLMPRHRLVFKTMWDRDSFLMKWMVLYIIGVFLQFQ